MTAGAARSVVATSLATAEAETWLALGEIAASIVADLAHSTLKGSDQIDMAKFGCRVVAKPHFQDVRKCVTP